MSQARWSISADPELRLRGGLTGLDYLASFEEYLHVLLVGLEKRKKHILALFREWDNEFFEATQDTGYGTTKRATAEANENLAEALNAIDEDEEESEEESDHQEEDGHDQQEHQGNGEESEQQGNSQAGDDSERRD